MKRLIVDTGIWYAVLDKTDSRMECADDIAKILEKHQLFVPYPSLYEAINTRLIKNEYHQADKLFAYLNNPEKVVLVSDDKYRETALKAVQFNLSNGKHYSLVDMIIRLMMEDETLGLRSVITFNVKDFCGVNAIEVIDPSQFSMSREKKMRKKK